MAAEAILKIKAQGAAQTNQEFQNLRKNITGNMTAAERSVASSLSSMAAQYISLGLVIRQVGKTLSQGVEFNKFIENQTMAFEVMMKSADKAKAKVKELYDFAVASPLTFKETVSSSKQLMAYGFAAEELVPTMEKLGAVSIATGHSLSDIAYVYGTLKSQGRAYSRDLMQFGMRGIPIYEELAKVLKVDVTQIQKMASEGKIGFKEVEKAFANMTEEGGRFGGILEKYMETLTGKIAMLSDIWEQTTGKMAEGLNKVLGRAVDDLTTKLESGELDGFLEGVSNDIEFLASSLATILGILIELAPVILTIAKAWLMMQIGGGILKVFSGLSTSLFAIARSARDVGRIFVSFPVVLNAITKSVGALRIGFGLLMKSIAANPVGLALLGLSAVATAAVGIASSVKANKEAEMGAMSDAQKEELARQGMMDKLNNPKARLFGLTDSDVQFWADEYKLEASAIERLASSMGIMTDAAERQAKALTTVHTEEQEVRRAQADLARERESAQKAYLASLTGADPETFQDDTGDFVAKGADGANLYIKSFADEMKRQKEIWGKAWTPELEEAMYKDNLKALEQTLIDSFSVEGLHSLTGFDDVIREEILRLRSLLEDDSGVDDMEKTYVSLEDTLKELGKWWLPEEARVQATLDAFDDMGVELRKQLETLDKETEARLDIIAAMDETADKARLLHELAKDRAQAEKDIYTYMQQQADILQYQENLSGKTNYWRGIEAKAGQGDMGAVAMTSMEGTEIGSLMAGGDPMTMIVKALTDFAMSIENVNKVLNPINTILEGARPILELFINSALQDIVNRLSALGVIIGKILAPFISLTQLFFLFSNTLYNLVLLPLEGIGWAFAWFNDHVIAPAGNTIIDLINTFIGWINKYTMASLPYMESIKKTTEANETYTKALKDAVSNATNALTGTISFLLDKFNSYIDEQVNSYQDLYEVGAISGAEYEKMVSALDDKLDPGSVNISDKDKALEGQGAIAARLMQLYSVQNQLDSGNLSEEQQLQLLMSAGLNTQSTTQLMMREAFEAAMKNVGVSTKATDIESASKNVQEIKTLQTGVTSIPHNVNSSWDKVINAAISMWTTIKTVASNIWSGVKDAASGIWSGVKTTASGIWSGVQTSASGIWGGVKTTANGIWAGVKTTASNIWSGVKDAALAPWKGIGNGIINIFNAIVKALNVLPLVNMPLIPALAVGTPNVPYDMMAQIHEGEGIIPKTFMDGVRSGEISIGRGGHGGDIYVSVNVEGNVTAEKDLAVSIAEVLYSERRAGRVAV